MSARLNGKVALITGAAKGIGRAIALRFAREGADVVITYNTSGKQANDTVREIESLGRRALAIGGDVSRAAEVKRIVDGSLKKFGQIDVLVNNAGVHGAGQIEVVDEAQWDSVLGTNLKSAYLCAKAVSGQMVERRRGSIISMSSLGAFLPGGALTYTVSKAGIVGFTRAMALNLAAHNVRVNAICPGAIKTDMFDRNYADPRLRKQRLMAIPMNRAADPDEVAGVALFLASDEASYVTGQAIIVDGGSSIAYYQFISRVAQS